MVHLSPSPSPDLALSPSPECSPVGNNEMSRMDSPTALGSIQLALAASTTTYHGYDTYIEDGLICLKHKIRNIEKKKLKLEDYKKRLDNGENLNQDQMDAVNKYEEVVHNLTFAKELQKSFASLTQDLLKAQRKVARREQVVRIEAEKRRLRTVLQVQYILQSLLQEHVRKDFRSGLNQAPFLSAHEVDHLLELAKLLGCQRDESMSLQDQMEQAAAIYWDLLEGRDKVVAGCTCKHLKDQLTRLMDCSYFDHIPSPHIENLDDTELLVTKKLELSKKVEVTKSTGNLSGLSTLMSANEVPTREFLGRRFMPDSSFSGQAQPEKSPTLSPKWKADFLALKQRDPPDSWEMEFDMTPTVKPALQKTWKGAAGFIPKEPGVVTKLEPKQETKTESESEPKQRRMRKLRGEQDKKLSAKADVPVEVFRSPTALTKDPVQRKQQLKSLMDQIQGSFSFMQDSILDSESSPIKRISTISAPSIGTTSTETAAQSTPNSQEKHLPKSLHSTPLPLRLHTNGDQMDEDKAAQITADNSELSESEDFASPPLYRQESATSVAESVTDQVVEQATCNGTATFPSPPSSHSTSSPAPFTAMHTVFKMSTPLPPRSDSDQKSDTSAYSDTYNLSYVTASTQTPPDIDLQDLETVQPVNTYPSEYPVSNGCQVYLSPGPPGGAPPRTNQPYYSRGSVRGMTRGGRGLTQPFRSPGSFDGYRAGLRSPGGYIPQTHSVRDCGPVLYGVRDTGYHSGYKRSSTGAAGTRSSRAWNSPSQMSSPDRDETFTSMDSGHGDSRCTTPIDVPVASPAFMPMHVYPVPQQMRVAFSAARTANFAPGSLDQPIVFDLLHSNLGETFDVDLGRFNCPVNGTYVFIFHILKLAVNVPLYVNLMKNEEVMVSAYANDGAPDHETASNHAVLQLYHGDQVWLRLHRGAIYGSSWKYSTFSGYLLYQD